MSRIAVQGADPYSPLIVDLGKALARSGSRLVEADAGPGAVLRFGANSVRTDVLSVGGNARANEYTIRHHVEFDVVAADAVTWSDGVALAVFDVTSPTEPDAADLVARVRRQAETPLTTAPLGDVELEGDQAASPWHTVIRAVAPDRVGLLAALTAAFAAAGARVEAARVETVDGRAMDRFELAGPGGDKLTPDEVDAIRAALAAGVVSRKRPLRREWTLAAAP